MPETDVPPDMAWFKKMEKVVSIVVPIFFSIIVFVGFVGNLLVVLVVLGSREVRHGWMPKMIGQKQVFRKTHGNFNLPCSNIV